MVLFVAILGQNSAGKTLMLTEMPGPDKATGVHNFEFYYPDQDGDGDGLPRVDRGAYELPAVSYRYLFPLAPWLAGDS